MNWEYIYNKKHLILFDRLKLINNFSNFIPRKNIKIRKKLHNYFKFKIKHYKYLNLVPYKNIKFFKVK